MPRRLLWLAAPLALVATIAAWTWTGDAQASAANLPARLSSEAFRDLSASLSEEGGFFSSDNLVSNELTFQYVIPELQKAIAPGGVYLGVGPDQNFTYIAALRPRVAFIVDIRRDNLLMHLMYKALFELSDDRADFVAQLFSRTRPDGVEAAATGEELFAAFASVRPNRALYTRTRDAVFERLEGHHGLALSGHDRQTIEFILSAFFASGPALSYSSSGGFNSRRYPSFQAVQLSTDQDGARHTYLGSAAAFQTIKAMQHNNLIVPVTGDFGGSGALRGVGEWVRSHGASVSVFYTSNVEQYLFQSGVWGRFMDNVATLPLTPQSTLIRSCFRQCMTPYPSISVTLLDSMPDLVTDAASGKIVSYYHVLNRSR